MFQVAITILMGLGLRRRLERAAARYPLVRRALTMGYIVKADYLARGPRHPFDRAYRVRTQSHVPLYLSRTGSAVDGQIVPYGGCVASVVRHALNKIGATEKTSFVDIGCGKGRALVIASERPFARIIGIELNPDVAAIARRNARVVARRFPGRTAIEVRVNDASDPDLPDGDLAIFLYHPFGAELVSRLCDRLAAASANGRFITIIYENPVHGAIFDSSPSFTRLYAAMLPCSEEERAFAFDPEEALVIWCARSSATIVDKEAERALVTIKPGFRVVVQSE